MAITAETNTGNTVGFRVCICVTTVAYGVHVVVPVSLVALQESADVGFWIGAFDTVGIIMALNAYRIRTGRVMAGGA